MTLTCPACGGADVRADHWDQNPRIVRARCIPCGGSWEAQGWVFHGLIPGHGVERVGLRR